MSLVEMNDIVKRFPGVLAVDHVDFELKEGEVHFLLGANGAGKTTLIKVLAGAHSPDEGTLKIRGEEVQLTGPRHAQELGIGTIYQEYNLVPYLTVAENIFLGHLPKGDGRFSGWTISRRELNERAAEILNDLDVAISPISRLAELSVAEQQMVEISKALALNTQIYIMDEPTAALSSKEIDELFRIIRRLKKRDCAILYISHRLGEINEVADRVSVLRDGQKVATLDPDQHCKDDYVELMVGEKKRTGIHPKKCQHPGDKILKVEGLSRGEDFQNINFHLCSGEIVGLAGVMGAGRTEVARAVFGADPMDEGHIFLRGAEVEVSSPKDAVELGICYLPEDRKELGLVPCTSVRDNIIMASFNRFCNVKLGDSGLVLCQAKLKEEVRKRVQELDIKTPGINQQVRFLSGGNQQKVVMARWLSSQGDVFIFDEPTRGIDVGAKVEVLKLVQALAEQGAGILLISSEFEDLIGVCSRIYVMREGQISAELQEEEISKEAVMSAALAGETTPQT